MYIKKKTTIQIKKIRKTFYQKLLKWIYWKI